MSALLDKLKVRLPVFLSPMAGVSTPALAAAVTNAGGLGSIALGLVDAETGRRMIQEVLTSFSFIQEQYRAALAD